ncbi:hypothetical protein TGMAS_213050 [Toxoplasma gondii MAS]|uniref:Uncharacterized protein n=1 Tax=Toxoplasma gondii MAS TaxID=943118 RepID=A0A086QD08_TOXGO|nr:hypothetical protein TGMAS_213050 [Toxoplasma gondii MAS]
MPTTGAGEMMIFLRMPSDLETMRAIQRHIPAGCSFLWLISTALWLIMAVQTRFVDGASENPDIVLSSRVANLQQAMRGVRAAARQLTNARQAHADTFQLFIQEKRSMQAQQSVDLARLQSLREGVQSAAANITEKKMQLASKLGEQKQCMEAARVAVATGRAEPGLRTQALRQLRRGHHIAKEAEDTLINST